MLIDAAAAQVLASIILISTQGADALQLQLPLQTVDRGTSWLVKGTPYTDTQRGMRFCFSHVILRKDTAEVVSIGSDIRMILTEKEEEHWHQTMSIVEFDRIFGPRTYFEEGGPELAKNLAVNAALYGGLINTPKDAIAYAKVILDQNAGFPTVPASNLQVEEQSEIWHIKMADPKSNDKVDLMSFSRMDGKVLSAHF